MADVAGGKRDIQESACIGRQFSRSLELFKCPFLSTDLTHLGPNEAYEGGAENVEAPLTTFLRGPQFVGGDRFPCVVLKCSSLNLAEMLQQMKSYLM